MYRFERTATIRHAAELPAAMQFAAEVTSFVNKRHHMDMKFGVEMFGSPKIHWYFDVESLDASAKLDATLLKDEEYEKLLKRNEGLWVDQSMHDSVVRLG